VMPNAEHKWPERPYPGLKSYGPEDLPLFAGRDADVTEFVDVLGQFPSRVLLLHGITGAGKTSFLRAGVIPFLSGESTSFHFLKKGSRGQERTALFVRSTDAPLLQVAESVQNFAAQGFVLVTPSGEQALALRDALLGHNSASSFREEVARAPRQLVHALSSLAEVLPGTLVLVMDQAEELLTLKPGDDGDASRAGFFEFLAEFATADLDVKLIISLRTEYYGRYRHEMHTRRTRRGSGAGAYETTTCGP
jgi:conflict system STAND superfamily ATPase